MIAIAQPIDALDIGISLSLALYPHQAESELLMLSSSSIKLVLSTPDGEDIDETDVVVEMENGTKYVATFCSFKKLKNLTDHRLTGPQHYQHFQNLVLVEELSFENIGAVIHEMIEEGDFQIAFRKLTYMS